MIGCIIYDWIWNLQLDVHPSAELDNVTKIKRILSHTGLDYTLITNYLPTDMSEVFNHIGQSCSVLSISHVPFNDFKQTPDKNQKNQTADLQRSAVNSGITMIHDFSPVVYHIHGIFVGEPMGFPQMSPLPPR